MDRVLFTEAGAEAGDPGAGPIGCGADQETETRGLDTVKYTTLCITLTKPKKSVSFYLI